MLRFSPLFLLLLCACNVPIPIPRERPAVPFRVPPATETPITPANVAGLKETLRLPADGAGAALTLAFTPDSDELRVAYSGGSLRRYRMPNGTLISEEEVGALETATVTFDIGGRALVSAADAPPRVTVLDAATGQPLALLEPQRNLGVIEALVISDNAQVLALLADNLTVWPAAGGTPAPLLERPRDAATSSLALGASGRLLAVGESGGRVRLWNTQPSRDWGTLALPAGDEGAQFLSLRVSPAQETLAAAYSLLDGTGRVLLWELTERRILWVATIPLSSALAFHPLGTLLGTAGEEGVRLWETANDAEVITELVSLPSAAVTTLAFSHDGTRLAYGTLEGEVRILELP